MSVMDFLFGGNAPQTATTYGSSTSTMPAWMSDYSQALMSRANQIAAQPAPMYTGPRVASATPDQNAAYDLTRSNIGSHLPFATEGADMMRSGANALDPTNIQRYMDPYVSNVINRAELEANRNFNEKIMPTLSRTFTANGQFGSSRMAEEANRASRDLTEGLQSQSMAALSDAFKNATNTAGQSGQLQLTGGQNLVNTGSAIQGMGLKDAAALESIGRTQQGQNQSNLDLAYGDWQRQTQHPQEQVNWLSTLLGNQAATQPRNTTETRTAPVEGTGGGSGLSDIAGLLTAAKGIYDIFAAEGGLIPKKAYADGGNVVDVRGDKRYAHAPVALSDPTVSTLSANSAALPLLTPITSNMDQDWYNTYGEKAEHKWTNPQSYSFTGVAGSGAAPNGLGPQKAPGAGVMDYIKMAKQGKDAYDKYQDLFGSGSSALEGMTYDSAGMLDATSGVDLTSGLGDISVATPTLDVASGVGSGVGAISSALPTLGSSYGLGALGAGTGATQTAASLGAGYSTAAPTVGSMFGTTAAEAGLGSTAAPASTGLGGQSLGSTLGSAIGSSAGQTVLGVLGLIQGYKMAKDTGKDLVTSGVDMMRNVLKPTSLLDSALKGPLKWGLKPTVEKQADGTWAIQDPGHEDVLTRLKNQGLIIPTGKGVSDRYVDFSNKGNTDWEAYWQPYIDDLNANWTQEKADAIGKRMKDSKSELGYNDISIYDLGYDLNPDYVHEGKPLSQIWKEQGLIPG